MFANQYFCFYICAKIYNYIFETDIMTYPFIGSETLIFQ